MSKWITDREPTRDDADCTGFVWITTEYGVVLREPWKTVRDRPWMPITPPEPYVEPPKRYKLMYRSTTRQHYIQDTESCDKRFVASCIPTREKADLILNIFEKQNIMSEWITDRLPSSADMDYVYGADGKIKVCYNVQKGEAWKPIPEVEPYVKPKRFHITDALHMNGTRIYYVWDSVSRERCSPIFRNRKAAEQIAKIYEEEML